MRYTVRTNTRLVVDVFNPFPSVPIFGGQFTRTSDYQLNRILQLLIV